MTRSVPRVPLARLKLLMLEFAITELATELLTIKLLPALTIDTFRLDIEQFVRSVLVLVILVPVKFKVVINPETNTVPVVRLFEATVDSTANPFWYKLPVDKLFDTRF